MEYIAARYILITKITAKNQISLLHYCPALLIPFRPSIATCSYEMINRGQQSDINRGLSDSMRLSDSWYFYSPDSPTIYICKHLEEARANNDATDSFDRLED